MPRFKNEWVYTSIPPIYLHDVDREKLFHYSPDNWKSNCDRSGLYSGRDDSVHPNFVMVSAVHVLVRSLVLSWRSKMSGIFPVGGTQRRQAFRLLSASTQQLEFGVIPSGTKYTRISSSSRKRDHNKFWKESGAPSTLHTWPFAIRLSTAWSFEKCRWGHHYANDGAV
jgi:hypothetical protein